MNAFLALLKRDMRLSVRVGGGSVATPALIVAMSGVAMILPLAETLIVRGGSAACANVANATIHASGTPIQAQRNSSISRIPSATSGPF